MIGQVHQYISVESAAKVVRTYEPLVIPGLLQAVPYAREVIRQSCPAADEKTVARLVELRLERQRRLENPWFRLWAIIDGESLAKPRVDVRVMRLQIAHLINVSELPNITVQALRFPRPRELDDHLEIREPVTQFRFPKEEHEDIIFLERPDRGVILTGRAE